MTDGKGILRTQTFYCDHISAADMVDIANFTVRKPDIALGLEAYIKEQAIEDERMGAMRTYLVRDIITDELAGYFSLKSGMVSLNEREIVQEDGTMSTTFDTVPGIEVANFAVNNTYLKSHENVTGLGIMIFRSFIRVIAQNSAETIGSMVLYIFALPFDSLIERYRTVYSFLRLDTNEENDLHKRLKPYYDQSCIFMYQML